MSLRCPVRVAEIEEVVGIVGIGLRGLVEVVRRQPALRVAAAPQLDDAEVVEHGRRRLLVGQRLVRPERIVVLLRGSSCESPPRKRARRAHGDAGGHRLDRRERALMIALLGVDIPQRETGAVVRRIALQRGVQIVDRRRRRFGEQSLDEIFESRDRRTLGPRQPDRRRGRRRTDGARRRAIRSKNRKQIRDRTALGHVGLHAARLEREASRAHDQPVGVALQRSDDHLRGADELGDPNHRRVGQHRRRAAPAAARTPAAAPAA